MTHHKHYPKRTHYQYLHVPDHWEQYWSKYPNGYTVLEALISWTGQVNDMVKTLNKTTDHVLVLDRQFRALDKELRSAFEGFKDYVNEDSQNFKEEVHTIINNFIASIDPRIQDIVVGSLTNWLGDGTLADIINKDVFNMKLNTSDFESFVSDIDSMGYNVYNNKHLVPNIDELDDPSEGDWTQAFQEAINNHRKIFVPNKHAYKISKINLKDNTIIESNYATIKQTVVDDGTVISTLNTKNTRIDGLVLDGSYDELEGGPTSNAFINGGGDDVVISNCQFVNLSGTAIIKTEGSNLVVRDCVCYDFRDHFIYGQFNSTNISAINCTTYDDVNSRGVYKMRAGARGLGIRDCHHFGGGQFLNIHSDIAIIDGVSVENCYVETTMPTIIFQNSDSLLSTNIRVYNSTFKNLSTQPDNVLALNWGSSASVDGLVIYGCEFIDYNGRLILGGTPTQYNKNIVIENNHIFTRDGFSGTNTHSFTNLENLMFRGNHVYGQYVAINVGYNNKSIHFIANYYYDVNDAVQLDRRSLNEGNIIIKDNVFYNFLFMRGDLPENEELKKIIIKDNELRSLNDLGSFDIESWGDSIVRESNYKL